jgi:alginate O-acetyltransferase complex protein AlgJ
MAEARRAGIPLYRRTDTHWNDFGAFVASRELHRTLTHWFPTVTVPENAGALVRYLPLGGYLARFLGLQAHLSDEEVLPLVVQQHASFEYQNGALQSSSTRPGAPIRRGYVLHDSFKSAMASYLSETFETVA